MEDCTRYDSLRQIPATKLSAEEFENLDTENRPFIITDVVGSDFRSWWRDEATKNMGSSPVYFVSGDALTAKRTLMEGTFDVFVKESERLSNRTNYAYLDTDLDAMPDLAESIRRNVPKELPVGDRNLFCQWPGAFRPSEFNFIVAGAGARTVFECEGFNAGQWHLCLSGHMRFKLFPRDLERVESLLDVRQEPIGILNQRREPIFEVCRRLSSQIDLFTT